MLLSSSLSFNEKETSALFPVISRSSLVSVKTGFRILHHFCSFSGANPLLRFALSNIYRHSAFKLVYFLLSLLTDASRGEYLGKSPFLLQKFPFFVFVVTILLTSLSIKDFLIWSNTSLLAAFLRLAASRLSSSAKTLAKSSVSHYSSCSTSFFFLCLLVCFIKNLLALFCLCFHVEGNMLCMITKTKFMSRKWLHKYFAFFMWT